MRTVPRIAFLFVAAALAGCAVKPQLPIPMQATMASRGQAVGVVMAKVPKASLELPGASCLLCIAAAQVANAPLVRHVDTLDAGELNPVRDRIAEVLRRKGMDVKVIAEPLALETLDKAGDKQGMAKLDFKPLQAKYGVEKLVVVNVEAIGVHRSYSAYIPVSDPRAFVRSVGFMVDLRSNAYDWYLPVNVFRAVEGGRWDEPPKYPGITNAYYQALEESKDRLLETWAP